MGLQVDINNASSYKNCAKKQYEIYVCMPPKNTIVINKLEQADVVKALGGRTYFTVDEIEKMQKTGNPRLAELQQLVGQGRAYAVTDATPFVLCGTVGEMWTITADKLASTYNFLQGGQPLAINQQTLNQRLNGKYLDWTLIRTSAQATVGQNMACFVPSSQKGQIQTAWGSILNYNGVGVSHGKGDFIVCGKLPNGQPNLGDRLVVNGEVFAATYNNQGWTDCLKQTQSSMTIADLPKLVSAKDKSRRLTIEEYNEILYRNIYFPKSDILDNIVPKQVASYYSQHKNEYKHEIKFTASRVMKKFGTSLNENNIKLNISEMMEVAFTDGVDESKDLTSTARSICGNLCYDIFNIGIADLLGAGAYIEKSCPAKEYSKALFNYLEYSVISSSFSPDLAWFYDGNSVKYGFVGGQMCCTFMLQSDCPDQYMFVDVFKDGIGVREVHGNSSNTTLPSSKNLVVVFSRDCNGGNFARDCITMSRLIFSKMNSYLAKSTVPEGDIVKGMIYCLNQVFSCLNSEVNEDDARAIYGVRKSDKNNFRLRIHKNAQLNKGENTASSTDSCTLFVKIDKDLVVSVSARSGGKTFDKNYNLCIGRGVDKVAGLIFIDLCRLFKLHPLRTLYSSKTTIKQVFDIANNHISEFSNNFRLDVVSMDTNDDTKVKVRFNICNKGTNSILGTRTFVIDFNYKNFDYSKSTSANTRTLAFLSSKGELEELSELLVCCYVSNGGSSFTDDYGSGADLNCSVSDVASSLYMSMEKILGNNLKYTKYIC